MTEGAPDPAALVVLAAVFAPRRVSALFSRLAGTERAPLMALAARAASAPRGERLAAFAAMMADLGRLRGADAGGERPRIAEVVARCGPFRPSPSSLPAPTRALGRLLAEQRWGTRGG